MFASGKTAAVASAANYIEDVFSTWLYTGTGASQTITNGIDLSTKGGLVWTKGRNDPGYALNNALVDTTRGASYNLYSNTTNAQVSNSDISAFGTTGYSFAGAPGGYQNNSGNSYVSWTFRKQPKFFDVVTGTGKGTFTHNLGVVPGCIILKRTSTTGNWIVAHNGLTGGITGTYVCLLNTTDAQSDQGVSLSPTATTFNPSDYVGNSDTWVAYFFASNAGGFGLTGTDNVISCGSFSVPDQGPPTTVTLGYEPQWFLVKRINGVENWKLFDTMRGWAVGTAATDADDEALWPNLSNAANPNSGGGYPTATGFVYPQAGGGDATYIYIAIRRGPMKVPTSGTSVFSPNYASSTTGQQITTGFPVDSQILRYLPSGIGGYWFDRLRGVSTTTTESGQALYPNATTAETTENYTRYFNNTGYQQNSGFAVGTQMIGYSFGRAPSFFDEVCYTGTGIAQALTHNLGVAPELIIVKSRSAGGSAGYGWISYCAYLNNSVNAGKYYIYLNRTQAAGGPDDIAWGGVSPTATQFNVGLGGSTYTDNAASGVTYVAYLFATCAGVSKVGNYTGNGTTQTINCGFTGGARFVLLKATSTTGNWMVYDTARGMTTLTDPFLSLNSTSAETATLGACTTVSTGFAVNESILAGVNTNGVSFVYLAIA